MSKFSEDQKIASVSLVFAVLFKFLAEHFS